VVAAHWIIAVWHLLLVAKTLPAPDNAVNWVAIGILTSLHVVVSIAFWTLSDRFTGLVLCAFVLVALGSGIYGKAG
jgi:hypothetical protein